MLHAKIQCPLFSFLLTLKTNRPMRRNCEIYSKTSTRPQVGELPQFCCSPRFPLARRPGTPAVRPGLADRGSRTTLYCTLPQSFSQMFYSVVLCYSSYHHIIISFSKQVTALKIFSLHNHKQPCLQISIKAYKHLMPFLFNKMFS